MQSIILLIPYFGKWPIWMELYLDSIKRNSTINFHFITDCDTAVFESIPNITYEETTFTEYVDRYKKLLGDDIQIPNAYKICDLRPFFGIVHTEIIKDYDFFGWTDVDIVYGDIRSFYTEDILNKYDVLSSHETRLAGHFALLRNSDKHRLIGYKIYQWKKALKNPQFVGIDEHGITNALQMTIFDKVAEKFRFSKDNFILNTLRKVKTKKHYFIEQYTTPFTPIPWLDGTLNSLQPNEWFYDQGVITNSRNVGRNFIYLHLMNFKSSQWRADRTPAPWVNGFDFKVKVFSKKVKIDLKGIRNI
jgi:hypothetical protein